MGKQTDDFVGSLTMAAIVLVLVVFLILVYRIMLGSPDSSWGREDFTVICVDGVQYYTKTRGYRGFMAVAIDKSTLLPMTCE